MCRLAIIKEKKVKQLNGDFFKDLEISNGGDGNSLSFLNLPNRDRLQFGSALSRLFGEEKIKKEKIGNLSIFRFPAIEERNYRFYGLRKKRGGANNLINKWDQIFLSLKQLKFSVLVFHTRIASTGGLERSHPAITKNFLFWQNGTEHYTALDRGLFGLSDWDTQATADLVEKFGIKVLDYTSSNWIVFDKKKNKFFVSKQKRDLKISKDRDVIASELSNSDDDIEIGSLLEIDPTFKLKFVKGGIEKKRVFIRYYYNKPKEKAPLISTGTYLVPSFKPTTKSGKNGAVEITGTPFGLLSYQEIFTYKKGTGKNLYLFSSVGGTGLLDVNFNNTEVKRGLGVNQEFIRDLLSELSSGAYPELNKLDDFLVSLAIPKKERLPFLILRRFNLFTSKELENEALNVVTDLF